jgi:hypothetical protein
MVAVIFFTERIAVNSFGGPNDGCFHIMDICFGFGCHMISPCFIPCNNSLQKLLSLTGIMRRMHEKVCHTMCFVISYKALWYPVCTHVPAIQRVMGVCCVHYSEKGLALRQCLSVQHACPLCYEYLHSTYCHPYRMCLGVYIADCCLHVSWHCSMSMPISMMLHVFHTLPPFVM